MNLRFPVGLAAGLSLAFVAAGAQGAAVAPRADADRASVAPAEALSRDVAWWRRYGDPDLEGLIDRALAHNENLALKLIAVRRARLQARYAAGSATLSANVVSTRSLEANGPAGGSVARSGDVLASYEIDLFGALDAARDVAGWEAHATAEDYRSAGLTLAAAVADAYFRIGYLNEQVARAEASKARADRLQALAATRRAAGAASAREMAEATREAAARSSDLEAVSQQRTEARSTLHLLLGEGTAERASELQRAPEPPSSIDLEALPAEQLSLRPDLHALELRVREQLAGIDATRLSFYPRLTVNGVLRVGAQGVLGLEAAFPFLQQDQVRLRTGVSRLQYEAAATEFRQALRRAIQEVSTALSARDRLAAQSAQLALALDAAIQEEALQDARVHAGAIPLQGLLEAQENRRQVENAAALNRLERLRNDISLGMAVGGEWGIARAEGSRRP